MMHFSDLEISFFDGKRIYTQMPKQAQPDQWIQNTDLIWKLPDAAVLGLRSIHWLIYEYRTRKNLQQNFDIYHETAFTPANIKNKIPQVFTLHDLSLMHYRHYHPKERVWFSDIFFNRRIHAADHIIVPSHYIKNEVCEYLSISEKQVTAIHEAPDPFFSPRPREQIRPVLSRLHLPEDYLLFVGTLEPRKNIEILIEALRCCSLPVHLVLTGWGGWGDKFWKEKIQKYGLTDRVHYTGYIDEEDLACLYSQAKALIYPSLYEGFGLPVLEAMACGCPVICSNAASLPEVAGDAALYFTPQKVDQLKDRIYKIYTDNILAEKMIKKGFQQASCFSWRQAAQQTRKVFYQIAS